MLIMSNNFIQLFFGWEAVGLVSYLLIGFYFKRPSAIFANLKAFLIQPRRRLRLLLGIGLVLAYFGGSLRYQDVFAYLPNVQNATIQLFPGVEWSLITVTCLLLFVGAMGKSAQFPLHVWLPDSMEGPDPDFRVDSRRDDGYGGSVHGVAYVADLRNEQHRAVGHYGNRRDYRPVYGLLGCDSKRHQTCGLRIPPCRNWAT